MTDTLTEDTLTDEEATQRVAELRETFRRSVLPELIRFVRQWGLLNEDWTACGEQATDERGDLDRDRYDAVGLGELQALVDAAGQLLAEGGEPTDELWEFLDHQLPPRLDIPGVIQRHIDQTMRTIEAAEQQYDVDAERAGDESLEPSERVEAFAERDLMRELIDSHRAQLHALRVVHNDLSRQLA